MRRTVANLEIPIIFKYKAQNLQDSSQQYSDITSEQSFDSKKSYHPVLRDKKSQTHYFGEVPHQFKRDYSKLKLIATTSLKKQRLAENIDPRFKYYYYFKDSDSDLMNSLEDKINEFLKKSKKIISRETNSGQNPATFQPDKISYCRHSVTLQAVILVIALGK